MDGFKKKINKAESLEDVFEIFKEKLIKNELPPAVGRYIASGIGTSSMTVSAWKHGRRSLNKNRMLQLKRLFNLSSSNIQRIDCLHALARNLWMKEKALGKQDVDNRKKENEKRRQPYELGETYVLQTESMTYIGKVIRVYPGEIIIDAPSGMSGLKKLSLIEAIDIDEDSICSYCNYHLYQPLILNRLSVLQATVYNKPFPLENLICSHIEKGK